MYQECDVSIGHNCRAVSVYVMPKYTLRYSKERREDMQCMMELALSKSSEDVTRAAMSLRTRTYDLNRHMYVRRTFVSVYVLENGRVVDMDKHWMEAAGQSEHAWFIA